jgi:ribosomal protein L14
MQAFLARAVRLGRSTTHIFRPAAVRTFADVGDTVPVNFKKVTQTNNLHAVVHFVVIIRTHGLLFFYVCIIFSSGWQRPNNPA